MARYRVTFEYDNVGINTAIRPIQNIILESLENYCNIVTQETIDSGKVNTCLILDKNSFTIEEIV